MITVTTTIVANSRRIASLPAVPVGAPVVGASPGSAFGPYRGRSWYRCLTSASTGKFPAGVGSCLRSVCRAEETPTFSDPQFYATSLGSPRRPQRFRSVARPPRRAAHDFTVQVGRSCPPGTRGALSHPPAGDRRQCRWDSVIFTRRIGVPGGFSWSPEGALGRMESPVGTPQGIGRRRCRPARAR